MRYQSKRPQRHDLGAQSLSFTKSTHWRYEQEWRAIRALSPDISVFRPPYPVPIHLFEFPGSALHTVIIGARASREFEDELMRILGSSEDYAHVALYRAKIDEGEFSLTLSHRWFRLP